jgi:hypothetical protein
MSAKERLRELNALRAGTAELNLIANAKCLTEGVDVPALDGVAFVDPRKSEVDIVQAVGRAIRLSADKRIGTIIVPVVCSDEQAAAGTLDAEGHRKLRQVLWALRAHDADLAIEIDAITLASDAVHDRAHSQSEAKQKISIYLDNDRLRAFADVISTLIVEVGQRITRDDEGWMMKYEAACEFFRREGKWPNNLSVLAPDGSSLGGWVNAQRRQGRLLRDGQRSNLSQERYDLLEGTEGWWWEADLTSRKDERWMAKYEAACEFFRREGRWPTTADLGPDGSSLGVWVNSQRLEGRLLRDGQQSKLSQARYDLLDGTDGWKWEVEQVRRGATRDPAVWMAKYEAACEFFRREGRWPTNTDRGPDGSSLGGWVGNQRHEGRLFRGGHKSNLSQERFDLLDGTEGWWWGDEWLQ